MTDSDPSPGAAAPIAGARRKLSRRKRFLFSLIILAFLGVVVEGSLQLVYRFSNGSWLWDWWAIPIYSPDPHRVYGLKPNLDFWHKTSEFSAHYQTDAAGMRTDGHQPLPAVPKPPGHYRILALGPSFAFGWGVNYEDAYLHRIASELRVPNKHVELVNVGTPSQPVNYQLKWLRETGYVYQPDLIVQTVYGTEEVEHDDVIPDPRPEVRDGYLYPGGPMTLSMRIRSWRRYSAVLFYGWHIYHALSGKDTGAGDGKEFYKKISEPDGTTIDGVVQSYQGYVHFVHGILTNKPPIVFIRIPLAFVVRPADYARVAHHSDAAPPLQLRERNARLASALLSNGVNLIDPMPALVEHDRETRMYNLYDIHFTVAGNKVVADLALPIIQGIVQTNAP